MPKSNEVAVSKKPMRKISAHLILDGRGNCFHKGILTIDQEGTILDIQDTAGILHESAEVEFFSGMIVPGFVNAHCHLELSHLQHKFTEGAGFIPFIRKVVESRNNEPDQVLQAADRADLLMYKNGIVAVGDIANGISAFEIKKKSKIFYFTFVETLGFAPQRASKAFDWALSCVKSAEASGLVASIVPHAPYSVSVPLFNAVSAEANRTGAPLSIHSQECKEEDELYQYGTGEMLRHLQENLSIDTSFFRPTGESALHSTLRFLGRQNHLLLVHNIYTNQADIDFIKEVRNPDTTWFVLCPGSNQYIQDMLPDIELFRENKLQICLGTDSLASNHQLSVLEEMKIIQAAYPTISLNELAVWASYNGAKALNIGDWAGSIEIGKRPGLNLLTGLDLSEQKLLPGTRVKKLG
jgi:cytosine/adenosine deaminase-related metal-dependent hydrolase